MPAPLWRIAAVAVIALVVILPQGPLQGMALAQAAGRSMNVPPIAAASDSEKRAAAPKHGALPLPDVSQRNPGRTGDGAAIRKLINEGTALTRTAAQASSETMAAATPPAAPKPAMTSTTAAPDASAGKGRRLRIGYQARTNETALNPAFFERLADFLPANADAREALIAAGFDGAKAEALRAEDHVDLVRRMDQEEFDLVFCSAMAFVQQTGRYAALLMTRSRRDTWPPSKGAFLWGQVVASKMNPVFAAGLPSKAALRNFIPAAKMAVVSNYSAVGYLYPLLKLRQEYGAAPGGLIFCDSSEEVAKFVINGLADLGALDEKALQDVAAQIPGKAPETRLVEKIARVGPVPTDPVAIRASLAPSQSRLGEALAKALKQYLNEQGKGPITVVDVPEDAYSHVKEAFEEFQGAQDVTRGGRGAASTSATLSAAPAGSPGNGREAAP